MNDMDLCIQGYSEFDWLSDELFFCGCQFDVSLYKDSHYQVLAVQPSEKNYKAVAKRKAEFLAGRYLAKRALEKLGSSVTRVPTGSAREPLWPNGYVGSISHSQGGAVCVLANSRAFAGLGIDIEELVSEKTYKSVQRQIVNQNESVLIQKMLSSEPGCSEELRLFTLIFSLKESFFKAAFNQVKRYFGFDAIEVIQFGGSENPWLEFVLLEDLGEKLQKGDKYKGYYRLLEGQKVLTLVMLSANSC